jgi:CheY-like chemotaxis protein
LDEPRAQRVLLIEDDDGVRTCLARVLSEAGFHPLATGDPTAALRAAAQEPFDAVVCDQNLPGTTGLKLLRALIDLGRPLVRRFVLATGDAEDPAVRRFAKARPERTLIKPFTNDELLAAVRRAAGASAPVAAR